MAQQPRLEHYLPTMMPVMDHVVHEVAGAPYGNPTIRLLSSRRRANDREDRFALRPSARAACAWVTRQRSSSRHGSAGRGYDPVRDPVWMCNAADRRPCSAATRRQDGGSSCLDQQTDDPPSGRRRRHASRGFSPLHFSPHPQRSAATGAHRAGVPSVSSIAAASPRRRRRARWGEAAKRSSDRWRGAGRQQPDRRVPVWRGRLPRVLHDP